MVKSEVERVQSLREFVRRKSLRKSLRAATLPVSPGESDFSPTAKDRRKRKSFFFFFGLPISQNKEVMKEYTQSFGGCLYMSSYSGYSFVSEHESRESLWSTVCKFLPRLKEHVGRTIAQAAIRSLPTAATRVRSRVWSSGICGGQSGAGSGFLRVLQFPPPIFIPPIAPQSPSPIILGWYNRPEVGAVQET
jgi:hypothetical protein